MQNFIQPGEVLHLAAPYDRLGGQGALFGNGLFGVAKSDVLNTVVGEFATEGVYNLAKTDSQAWVLGDKIFWDASNKRCDNTVVGPLIGICVEAVASTAGLVTGKVALRDGYARKAQAAVADTAAAAAATAGGSSPTAGQVDTGIATAVAPIVTSLNALLARLRLDGIILP